MAFGRVLEAGPPGALAAQDAILERRNRTAEIHFLKTAAQGQVVCVSSIAAQSSSPGFAAYAASKSALDTFVRALAQERAASGESHSSSQRRRSEWKSIRTDYRHDPWRCSCHGSPSLW